MTDTTPLRAVRVLLVDDEPAIRSVLKRLLARSGAFRFETEEAANGEEAIAMLDAESFDIVVSDFRMDQKTGVDVLERAAERSPDSGRILVTGYAELDMAVDAVNRGRLSGFVRKPWEAKAMLTLIESIVPRAAAGPAPTSAPAAASASLAPPLVSLRERTLADAAPEVGHAGFMSRIGRAPPAPTATRPVIVPAPREALHPNQPPPDPLAGLPPERRAEFEEIERKVREVRVLFGVGRIGPERYKELSDDLARRRAALEEAVA